MPTTLSSRERNARSAEPPLLQRSTSAETITGLVQSKLGSLTMSQSNQPQDHQQPKTPPNGSTVLDRSNSPPQLPRHEAVNRAMKLSRKLSSSNIRTKVTETGDLMLDMTGFKSTEDDALRAELVARKILSEELEGNYDIGALIGADEQGNLWIYSSEEAKELAQRNATMQSLGPSPLLTSDAASDPGYHTDDGRSTSSADDPVYQKRQPAASVATGLLTPPESPPEASAAAEISRSYAKTLRLTSDQLKSLGLKAGINSMSFSVNRATCQAYMYYWKCDVPIVVSDIDGTITK